MPYARLECKRFLIFFPKIIPCQSMRNPLRSLINNRAIRCAIAKCATIAQARRAMGPLMLSYSGTAR